MLYFSIYDIYFYFDVKKNVESLIDMIYAIQALFFVSLIFGMTIYYPRSNNYIDLKTIVICLIILGYCVLYGF